MQNHMLGNNELFIFIDKKSHICLHSSDLKCTSIMKFEIKVHMSYGYQITERIKVDYISLQTNEVT